MMVYDVFIDCIIWFANVFLRIFIPIFIRHIGVQFSFLVVSSSGFGIRVVLALSNEFSNVSSSTIFLGKKLTM